MVDDQGLPELPDEWTQVVAPEDSEGQMLEAYQRLPDGLVLAVEEGTVTNHRYAVTALPENWRDDNQPIRRYGDNGYLWTGDDRDEATRQVEQAMTDLTQGR